jgi:hypothetical protein
MKRINNKCEENKKGKKNKVWAKVGTWALSYFV